MMDNNAKLAHILLVEDNEGDILLTLEAFEECKLKTEISIAKMVRRRLIFYTEEALLQKLKNQT
jgi:hypothetical protein